MSTPPRKRARRVRAKRPPRSALKAPFPWFGGKSRVALHVWDRFGDTVNYVEPFAGSLAVMLGRPPAWSPPAVHRNETVNDVDCMIANFWRALQHAPDEVAHYADWPVNEADLHARHKWLHSRFPELREKLHGGADDDGDPEWYDAKIAGWWVWGISCWIGDGWCRPQLQGMPNVHRARGCVAHGRDENRFQTCNQPRGVHGKGKRPMLKSGVGPNSRRVADFPGDGTGLDGRRPEIKPMGVHVKRPRLGAGERGVHAKLPDVKGRKGVDRVAFRTASDGTRPSLQPEGVHAGRARPYAGEKGSMWDSRPQLDGVGVHRPALKEPSRALPHISGDGGASGKGVNAKRVRTEPSRQLPYTHTGGMGVAAIRTGLYAYMHRLAERLRYVRVCCGDWKRILRPSPTVHIGTTAVFLDPPYGASGRDKVYNHDGLDIAADVRLWCFEHGDDHRLRIALCGYEGEHEELEYLGWDVVAWKAGGGYGGRNKANRNAERERIWFSPGCLKPSQEQVSLLGKA